MPTNRCMAVGYGSARVLQTIVTVEFVLLPAYGSTGAADNLRYYRPGSGFTDITPPQAGWRWFAIAVAPGNPDTWLLLGNTNTATDPVIFDVSAGVVKAKGSSASPLYRSTDAGQTWTAVTLSGLGAATACSIAGIDYGDAGWIVTGMTGGNSAPGYVWTGTANASAATTVDNARGYLYGVAGSGSEVILSTFTPDRRWRSLSGGSITTPGGTAPGVTSWNRQVRLPGTSRVVAALASDGTLWATSDYRALQPRQRVSGNNGTSLAAATHGVYIGGRTGIARVSDLLGMAILTVVAASGVSVGMVACGRQQRVALAVLSGDKATVYASSDGTTWDTVVTPSTALSGTVEVIERSTQQ